MSSSPEPNEVLSSDLKATLRAFSRPNDAESKPRLKNYSNKAKAIFCEVDPFVDVEGVLYACAPGSLANGDSREETTYQGILETVPGLEDLIDACEADARVFRDVVMYIKTSAQTGRSGDLGSLRRNWSLVLLHDANMGPDFLKEGVRFGWESMTCARLMVPLRQVSKFLEDPRAFSTGVRVGSIKIDTREFPAYLFPFDVVHNAQKPLDGMFRGRLVVNTIRALFTSPGSVDQQEKKANVRTKAELRGMTKITPKVIVYAALLVRQVLAGHDWKLKDSYGFDYPTYYDKLLKLLSNPDSPFTKSTLKFFNENVSLARARKPGNKVPAFDDDDENEFVLDDELLAQHAANYTSDSEDVPRNNQQEVQRAEEEQQTTGEQDNRQTNEPRPRSMSPLSPVPSSPTSRRPSPPSSRQLSPPSSRRPSPPSSRQPSSPSSRQPSSPSSRRPSPPPFQPASPSPRQPSPTLEAATSSTRAKRIPHDSEEDEPELPRAQPVKRLTTKRPTRKRQKL